MVPISVPQPPSILPSQTRILLSFPRSALSLCLHPAFNSLLSSSETLFSPQRINPRPIRRHIRLTRRRIPLHHSLPKPLIRRLPRCCGPELFWRRRRRRRREPRLTAPFPHSLLHLPSDIVRKGIEIGPVGGNVGFGFSWVAFDFGSEVLCFGG